MKTCAERKNLIKIANIAGVSLTTASRVFSDHPYVKDSTRKRVRDAAHQINYEPRVSASKRNIGVIVESLEFISEDSYLSTVLSCIAKQLSDKSLGFELIPVKELYKLQENFIKTAIAILYQDESIAKLKKFKKMNFIMINNVVKGLSSVCSDHRQGIELAYNHLRDSGHTKIALFMDHFEGWGCQERQKAFLALQKQHAQVQDKSLLKSGSAAHLNQNLADILEAGVTGIIISPESASLRVMSEVNRMGIKVPDDLSVVSFESACVSKYLYPAQTTVCQGFESLVQQAVNLAVKSIDHQLLKPENIRLGNTLIFRDSVRKI